MVEEGAALLTNGSIDSNLKLVVDNFISLVNNSTNATSNSTTSSDSIETIG